MSGQQKRGFRLPWAAERSTEDGAGAATLEADSDAPTTPEAIEDGVGGELGDGPFHFADAATPDASTDASPEAPEVPQTTAEAAMMETETVTTEPAAGAAAMHEEAWPTPRQDTPASTETAAEPTALEQAASDLPVFEAVTAEAAPQPVAAPAARVEADPRATRSNPLVAGLVKAMREAALASREETTGRLTADATAQVELLREAGTARAAELRKRADEDIAGIRDWSKSEVARIKQETDERIEGRKGELAAQTERHEADVEHQVELVQSTVAAFEADMDRFFERLLSENDPAKLAALAEQAPEPPDLAGDLAELDEPEAPDMPTPTMAAFDANEDVDPNDAGTDNETHGTSAWDDVAWGGPVPPELADPDAVDAVLDSAPEATAPAEPALEAEAAAQAEAASTEGLEMPAGDVWPTSVLAAARRTLHHPAGDFEAAGVANTRLYVNGLTSVAGISAFKGALGQLSGVRSVSVSSGEPGVFIFTVVHSPEADLQDGVASLSSFSARVTEASDDSLTVVAEEPEA
jgi:hypothetical protein